MDESLETSAEILQNSIIHRFVSVDYYYFKKEMEELVPKTLLVKIIDKNGVTVYQKKEFNINIAQEDWKKIYINKKIYKTVGNIRVLMYPFNFYGKQNVIILGSDIQHLNKIFAKVTITFFVIMFFILGVSLFSSILIINGILKAIKTISDSSKKIERNNLKHRIENIYNTNEIDELILTLNEMLGRIENGFEKIAQFSSDVSHELKTPLASIKGMIEVELTSNRSIEEYRETMIKVLEEADWLILIINDLLLMTRIEYQKEDKKFEKINITELIREICDLLSVYAEENKVNIYFYEKSNIYINGNLNKLKRMILNLISNGIKYNRENGFVNIGIEEKEEKIRVKIEDNGVGIKKENINKVFERFYREDKIRTTKKSGSGLGLSIAETIIKFHNGNIEIESIEGEGTKIYVELPKN